MTQNVVNYSDNPTGPELLDNYLDKDQENILTCNAGVQRPSYATQGTFWLDTSTTPWTYKMYDGSSDCKVGTFNSTSHKFNAYIETLTNNLTLTNNTESYRHISSTNTAVTKGTTPSANTGTAFLFRDSQDSFIGSFSIWYNTGGIIRAGFRAFAPTAESNGYGELVMDTTETGSQLSFITYNGLNNTNLWGASSDTSRNLVALQGWVNNPSMSTNVVHRSGNETITGRKVYTDTTTFTTHPVVQSTTEYSSIGYRVQNTQITRGTAPTTGNASGQWVFQDAGGLDVNHRIGGMEVTYLTNGDIRTSLQVFQPTASTTQNPYTYSNLSLIYPASGDPYAIAPTPGASVVGNEIITAKWYVPNYSKATNKSAETKYTPTKDVRVIIAGTIQNSGNNGTMEARVQINNADKFTFYGGYVYGYNEDPFYVAFDVKAGDSYKLYKVSGTLTVKQFIEIPYGG
ncbi:MAG: hypothetical protein J6W96_01630 [Alphaproteobacteria bacterium]|nr:hypothetical protein [Alphaproteobacteria bacterium]